MADRVFTGTVGLHLRLTLLDNGVVHNPSAATVREITIIQPDGVKLIRNAASGVTVATDSQGRACLQYVTAAGELDKQGTHAAVGYLEDATGKWPARPVSWTVWPSRR